MAVLLFKFLPRLIMTRSVNRHYSYAKRYRQAYFDALTIDFDMYYRFKTETELNSQTDIHKVNRAIRKVLKEQKTDRFETIENIVRFKNSSLSGKCRSNISYMTIVDKGEFKVFNENSRTVLCYESFSSFWGFILMFIIICLFGFGSKSFEIFIIGCVFLGISIFLTYLTISKGSIAILNKVKEILENENTSD